LFSSIFFIFFSLLSSVISKSSHYFLL
jgi:hypothetical protein